MKPVHVNDLTFQKEVLEADVPVLVDFWAPWCAPCRVIAPTLEEIAEEYGGRLKVVKLNTDENSATALKYNIRSIPTLLLFRNGQIIDEMIGVVPKQTLKDNLNYYLQGMTVLN